MFGRDLFLLGGFLGVLKEDLENSGMARSQTQTVFVYECGRCHGNLEL